MNIYEDDEIFYSVEESEESRSYLATLLPLRGNLYLDPELLTPWSCDPARCRPLLGRNLCCHVQIRCADFKEDRCQVHGDKPLSCALFPVDLINIGHARCVILAKDPLLYQRGWTRFDRDMLSCFVGEMREAKPAFEMLEEVLGNVFTASEMAILKKGYEKLKKQA